MLQGELRERDVVVKSGLEGEQGVDEPVFARSRFRLKRTRCDMAASLIEPMLPFAGRSLPEREEEWAFEIKFDGFRAVITVDGGQVHVQSRNLRTMTPFYPELQALSAAVGGRRMVLDGELVAYDSDGRQSLERMQERAGIVADLRFFRRGNPGRASRVPIAYQVFDVLRLDGTCLCARPYLERRSILESLGLAGSHWDTPSVHRGAGAAQILAATRQAGLEGLVAKRLDSAYELGQRSPSWLKFKNWCRQELLVCGWRQDEAGAGGWLGSLALGYYDGAELRYAGSVELGLRGELLEVLRELLPELAQEACPFLEPPARKPLRFLQPRLVVDVQFMDWTSTGRVRHAVLKGFVIDRDPSQVRREPTSQEPGRGGEERPRRRGASRP